VNDDLVEDSFCDMTPLHRTSSDVLFPKFRSNIVPSNCRESINPGTRCHVTERSALLILSLPASCLL
jgi:hypothetical protein